MLLDPAFGDMDNVFFSLFPTSLLCEKRPCQPELLAVDSVGNQTVGDVGLRLRAKARTPRIIEYTGEKFLSRVNDLYLEYLQTMQIGLDDSIDISPATEQFAYRFQKLNEDYRDYIDQGLLQGFRKTEGNRYWRGPLLSYAGDLIVGFGDSQLFKLNGITAGKFQSRGVTWTNLKDDKIRAANTGKVVFTGSNGVYGNAVVIDHGFGLSSFYAHLDTILVRVGDKVSKSTVIGRAGTSGLMAQQSLHFQLRLHGVPIDPSPWWNTSWVRREIDRKLSSIKRKLGISGFSVLHGFGP
jgi:murein DD-endopeptidase MepM/ murein hydrolase activator NlpD